jgi:hypothetical protein
VHTDRDACHACSQETEISSHLQLDYDEDGNPQQLRFVYVAMSKQGQSGRPALPKQLTGRGLTEARGSLMRDLALKAASAR